MSDRETSRPLPETVVQQPDPMLDEQRPGPFRIGLTMLGAAVVVVLVMYGLSRPTEKPAQMANAPEASSGGQAAAPAPQGQQAGKANGAAQPSTTGQGQAPTENQQQQTQQGRGKSPRSDSATTGQASAPSDKAAPPPKK
jgi:hypothetical protein